MASNFIVEEEMDLSGDSTVEYYGSSIEYESDGSLSIQALVMSSSAGDSDDSYGSSVDGSSVDGSVTEEVETDGDDGNNNSDSWKCKGGGGGLFSRQTTRSLYL